MLRMVALTLGSLYSAFLIFGGELSLAEKAELDALRSGRTTVVAVLSEAFNPSPNRQGAYVPTLAELKASNQPPTVTNAQNPASALVHRASFTPQDNVAPSSAAVSLLRASEQDLIATTTVADPAKLSALMASNVDEEMVLRAVTANRVNVRSGPSTNNAVLGSVVKSDIVRVISNPTDAWVKIVIEGAGVEGYMSSRFLTETAQ